jgi:hypothetical protein
VAVAHYSEIRVQVFRLQGWAVAIHMMVIASAPAFGWLLFAGIVSPSKYTAGRIGDVLIACVGAGALFGIARMLWRFPTRLLCHDNTVEVESVWILRRRFRKGEDLFAELVYGEHGKHYVFRLRTAKGRVFSIDEGKFECRAGEMYAAAFEGPSPAHSS